MSEQINIRPSVQALGYVMQARIKPFPALSINQVFVKTLLKAGYISLQKRPSPYEHHPDNTLIDFIFATDEGTKAVDKLHEKKRKYTGDNILD